MPTARFFMISQVSENISNYKYIFMLLAGFKVVLAQDRFADINFNNILAFMPFVESSVQLNAR
jgi:hypothetical protein